MYTFAFLVPHEHIETIFVGLRLFPTLELVSCDFHPKSFKNHLTVKTEHMSIMENFMDWYAHYIHIGGENG